MKILANLDMVKNQIVNLVLHVVAGTPSSPVEGQVWYDTTADRLKYEDASGVRTPWTADGDIPNAEITNVKLATNPLARANHTGTQLLATISDVTSSAAELNILDGATLDVTELNYVDGVTSSIQTQLNTKLTSYSGASYTTATAIGTAAKTVSGAEPPTGALVTITFTNGNSAASPTVSFNGGTARAIQLGGVAATAIEAAIAAGGDATFYFDGTNLNLFGAQDYDPTTLTVGGDLTGTVSNAQIGSGVIVNADINASANIALSKLAVDPLARANHTGTQTASTISDFDTQVRTSRLDQLAAAGADVSLATFKITNLGNPTAATDAANKQYVDDNIAGLSWKDEVRVATTAAGTLASSFENGDTIDGVTLATNDRILIKDQAAGAENGIYTVNASGAPTRALDANTAAEVQGLAVYVANGTTNGATRWVNSNTGTITLGTTALTFAQFGGGATYTAGNGLTLTGNDFNVGAGTGISVDATNVNIDTAVVVRKFSQTIGDNSTTAIAVTHSLGTKDITWSIRTVSDDTFVEADVTATSTSVATFTFAVAPSTNQYRVTIHA